ncbi:molecular chaperone [Sinimarinibacterium sp. CAU 1509]|uniref:fimbrial biogenesis chaperone n=1 Tax=Sinimarinibacterium sp. CAU 1509 TaxID=2562283 RepID=UPI0010AD6EBD|nr:fimbria/pilus periplasmic chaperone [Sinimarinibacterium sp. CAU 1509]TJY62865.1 molecular chaperone [Sinimarinibacterium sp. CAU 1509]
MNQPALVRRAFVQLSNTLLFVLLLALGTTGVHANGVKVTPVRLYLGAHERSTAVTLNNGTAQTKRFQVEVQQWSQVDGNDVLQESSQVIANPPLFSLKPDQTQVIRIGFLKLPDQPSEQAYRIFVREVPDNGPVDPAAEPSLGVQVLIRYAIPLFVAPSAPIKRQLIWTARRDDHHYIVTAQNNGNVHERRAQLKVYAGESSRLLGSDDALNDLLPGTAKTWTFPADTTSEKQLRIEAISDRPAGPVIDRILVH